MPPHCKKIAPELVAEGRRLYEQTRVPVPEIAALLGVSGATLQVRITEWGWRRRRYDTRSIDRVLAQRAPAKPDVPGDTAPVSGQVLPLGRIDIAARVQDVVERELKAVERVLDVLGPSDRGEAECTARTLASLSRTLRELAFINRTEETATSDDHDDDAIPRDIDEFRYELARRIHAFVDAREGRDNAILGDAAPALE